MTGAANRRRGADAERAVVNYLKNNGWPQARRVLAGDGHQHSDIDGIPGVSIEVKDRSSSAWPTWRQQAIEQARPGDTVIVVRRTRGVTNVGQWEAQMPVGAYLRLRGCTGSTFGINDTVTCTRTDMAWLRTTFRHVVALLAVPRS